MIRFDFLYHQNRNIVKSKLLYIKKKDSYEHDREDWKYCIEGKPRDTKIRII